MNTERLLHLKQIMQDVANDPARKFNIRSWMDGDDLFKEGKQLTPEEVVSCGTACCALGWAAADPEFYKAGLRLEVKSVYAWSGVPAPVPVYGISDGYLAGVAFFDISMAESLFLFEPGSYEPDLSDADLDPDNHTLVTPAMVIAHIDELLDGPTF